MNLQDQVIYRCLNAACVRPMPCRVDFCPYCGSAQHEGAPRSARAAVIKSVPVPEPVAKPVAPAAPPVEPPAFAQQVQPAPAMPAPAAAAPRRARAWAAGAASVPPPKATPGGTGLRKPVRLRYWLVALAVLAGIWYIARPEPKKFEARIEQAILQAEDCNLKEARAELQALRNDNAGAAQIERLQSSISAAATACERKRKSATKTKPKRETAPATVKPAVPVIERSVERPVVERPAGQSARSLIAEAERDIAQGNYRAASNKLETCIAMVEGSRECAAYKVHADRLLRDMQHCVATGRDWMNQRCM